MPVLSDQIRVWCSQLSGSPVPNFTSRPSQATDVWITNNLANGFVDTIAYWGSGLGAQPTSAQLAAFTDAQVTTLNLAQTQSIANALFTGTLSQNYIDRAIVYLTAQELNQLITALTTLVTAITATGATLATIQTAAKTITLPATITYTSAKTAIASNISNGLVNT